MTPAIKLLEKMKVAFTVHPYAHDESAEAFGLEAAEKLGVDPQRVFKTLVVDLENGPPGVKMAFAIIPSDARLNLKQVAAAIGAKRAALADPQVAEKVTGYVVGGISAIGGKKVLPVIIDETCDLWDTLFVSAGRRGLQIEIASAQLVTITKATVAPLTGV